MLTTITINTIINTVTITTISTISITVITATTTTITDNDCVPALFYMQILFKLYHWKRSYNNTAVMGAGCQPNGV